jgi:hypothetical protein
MSVDSDSCASGRSDVQVSVSVCSAEGAARVEGAVSGEGLPDPHHLPAEAAALAG